MSIQRGGAASLLSIKMSDGIVFNVSTYNDTIQDLKEGDKIVAKVINRLAQSESKK